uniref:UBIQUITIN_CONJUGAT_2 domain-containing protein n=1 Tax=Steinernema glaseri TaxID=37863 RepID=A0A1I7Z175_9BILA
MSADDEEVHYPYAGPESMMQSLGMGGYDEEFPYPKTVARLRAEAADISRKEEKDIFVEPSGENLLLWHGVIEGPPNSLYEEGIFHFDIHINDGYPTEPPKVSFRTRIYHCNITSTGDIFCDALNRDWSPTMGIRDVLKILVDLMRNPRPTNIRQPGHHLRQKFLHDRADYERIAREWASKYAS